MNDPVEELVGAILVNKGWRDRPKSAVNVRVSTDPGIFRGKSSWEVPNLQFYFYGDWSWINLFPKADEPVYRLVDFVAATRLCVSLLTYDGERLHILPANRNEQVRFAVSSSARCPIMEFDEALNSPGHLGVAFEPEHLTGSCESVLVISNRSNWESWPHEECFPTTKGELLFSWDEWKDRDKRPKAKESYTVREVYRRLGVPRRSV